MLIGIFLVISLSLNLASLGIIILEVGDSILVNYITGAVIGPDQLANLAVPVYFITLIITLILILIIRSKLEHS